MKSSSYFRPDGTPITLNLNQAAQVNGLAVTALRNYVARNILEYVGSVPLAGQERRFAVWGLYELGLIEALNRAGYTLAIAADIVHAGFLQSLVAGFLASRKKASGKWQTIANRHERDWRKHLKVLKEGSKGVPNLWLRGEWEHRNLKQPAIWVFCLNTEGRPYGPWIAKGWKDVPFQIQKLIAEVKEVDRSQVRAVSTLNLTATLADIDRRIQQILKI